MGNPLVAVQLDEPALSREMQAGIVGYTGSCPEHSQTQNEGGDSNQHARKQPQKSKMALISQTKKVKVPE